VRHCPVPRPPPLNIARSVAGPVALMVLERGPRHTARRADPVNSRSSRKIVAPWHPATREPRRAHLAPPCRHPGVVGESYPQFGGGSQVPRRRREAGSPGPPPRAKWRNARFVLLRPLPRSESPGLCWRMGPQLCPAVHRRGETAAGERNAPGAVRKIDSNRRVAPLQSRVRRRGLLVPFTLPLTAAPPRHTALWANATSTLLPITRGCAVFFFLFPCVQPVGATSLGDVSCPPDPAVARAGPVLFHHHLNREGRRLVTTGGSFCPGSESRVTRIHEPTRAR